MKTMPVAAILLAAHISLTTVQAQNPTAPVQFASTQKTTLSAEDILTKHIQALGGLEKLRSLKTVLIRQTTSAQNQDIQQTLYVIPGEGIRSEINAMGTEIIVVARADSGWQVNPALYGNQKPMSLEATQIKSVRAQSDLFGPLVSVQAKGHAVTYEGDEKVDGELCYKLTISTLTGNQFTTYVSQKSNMLHKMTTKNSELYYLNYKNVGGYMFPEQIDIYSGGVKASINERSFEVNKPFDDALFKMPAAQ
ncbi:hypothetical protein [Spirosoma sp. KNUC1025]|uniref:hypothetical protein n=1 Tax=Spirosoma sp. KNUC1025 TaxID=2894082 RepID=UPI00386C352E|nr:outer membrane lipoprotein-sorting protein [Spirosoma sp. KNUC1025]